MAKKGCYLNKTQLQELKQLLIADRARILKSSLRPGSITEAVETEDLSDEMDHATAEVNQSMTFRLRDRERFLLSKIDKALARMEVGEYGFCTDCQAEIGFQRLKARVVTDLCINCKEDRERKERSFASM